MQLRVPKICRDYRVQTYHRFYLEYSSSTQYILGFNNRGKINNQQATLPTRMSMRKFNYVQGFTFISNKTWKPRLMI